MSERRVQDGAGGARRVRRPEPLPALVRGRGPVVLFLHGFALHPRTYAGVVDALAAHGTIVMPALFRQKTRWSYDRVLQLITERLDTLEPGPVSVIGHSFGGGVALGLAARHPGRVGHLALVDSLGLTARWDLAREAFVGTRFRRLAHREATREFVQSCRHAPLAVMTAGWWAFRADKRDEIDAVRQAGTKADVVWGVDDSLLSPAKGADFAARLGARFTGVAWAGHTVEHDWPYRHPELFARTMTELGLVRPEPEAVAGGGEPR